MCFHSVFEVVVFLFFYLQSISHMKVMQFQGSKQNSSIPISLPPVDHYDLTPSPDVPLAIMKRKLMATNDIYEAKAIVKEMKSHLEVRVKRKCNMGFSRMGLSCVSVKGISVRTEMPC